MRKVMLSLSSFLLGACCMWLVGGSHTSISPQPALADVIINGLTVAGGGILVGDPGAIPLVRPQLGPAMNGVTGDVKLVQLDGLNCKDLDLTAANLTYGGGNFRFDNCRFNKVVTVSLSGAARNTVLLLEILNHLIAKSTPLPNPNTPAIRKADVSTPMEISFSTLR